MKWPVSRQFISTSGTLDTEPYGMDSKITAHRHMDIRPTFDHFFSYGDKLYRYGRRLWSSPHHVFHVFLSFILKYATGPVELLLENTCATSLNDIQVWSDTMARSRLIRKKKKKKGSISSKFPLSSPPPPKQPTISLAEILSGPKLIRKVLILVFTVTPYI